MELIGRMERVTAVVRLAIRFETAGTILEEDVDEVDIQEEEVGLSTIQKTSKWGVQFPRNEQRAP